jgi:hypothetical protein
MIYLTDYNKTWMPMEGAFVEIFDSAALEEKLDIEIYNMSPSEIWQELLDAKENPSDWMIMRGCDEVADVLDAMMDEG